MSEEGMLSIWRRQDPSRNARKKARRLRIRRQSEELTGKSIVFDNNYEMVEAKSLRDIEIAEYAAGFEGYSDDEDTYSLGMDVEESVWRWAVEVNQDYQIPAHFI